MIEGWDIKFFTCKDGSEGFTIKIGDFVYADIFRNVSLKTFITDFIRFYDKWKEK